MRLWIIVLIAIAAAIAAAAPIVIPKQLPPVRVPVNHVQYRTLHTVKPWSDTVTVYVGTNYIPDSVTHAWSNVTLYYHPPWAARHVATVTPAMQRVTVLYVFSTPTYVAINPVVTASAGVNVWIAIIANATRPDTTLYCEVGMEFAGGRVIACLQTTATGSLQYIGWLNVSYVTSIAVATFSTADYISSAGAVLDVSRTVWVTAPGLTVPATPRRPVYAAVANMSGVIVSATPNPSAIYIDTKTMTTTLVYENVVWTNNVAITGTQVWVKHRYALSVPHPVTLTHTYIDGSESSATVQSAGDYYVIDDYDAPLYIVAAVGSRNVKIFAPGFDEHIRLAPIPSTQTPVTFYVYDYGQGFTQLRIYTFDGRLVWRDIISAATQSVVAMLQPYDVYVIALWKPGEERALGPIVIDKTSFTLTVLPRVAQPPPPPSATVTYNSTIGAYVVDVSCAAPPCTVTLTKTEKLPGVTLEREVEVKPGTITILIPHLYDWYFDGVDDYVRCGFYDALKVTTGLTMAARILVYPDSPTGRGIIQKNPSAVAFDYNFYLFLAGHAGIQVRNATGATFGARETEDVRGKGWRYWVGTFDGVYLRFYRDGVLRDSRMIGPTTLQATDTPLSIGYGWSGYVKVSVSHAIIFNRALSDAEVYDLYATNVVRNNSDLVFFVDPTWCTGDTCFNLAHPSAACRMYNGVARVPANQTWLWVVYSTGTGVRLMYMRNSMVTFMDVVTGRTYMFPVYGDDVTVDVPPGTYRVRVKLNELAWQREVATFTCSTTQCRFTWQASDPFLQVTVVDAAGNVYNTVMGTTLVFTQTHVESFQRVFGKIAEHFAMFDNANGVKFAAALLGVLIFLALTIPGFLMVGLIVLAIYNAVVGMLLGFTLLSATALPIIVIIGILHYIAKHA